MHASTTQPTPSNLRTPYGMSVDLSHLEAALAERNREITEKTQKIRQLSFELYAARVALREIKDGRRPQVCAEFELCTHEGCAASYAAYAIADAYFRTITEQWAFVKATDAVVQEGIDFAKKVAARLHLCSNPSHWDEPHPCMLCEQEKKS